MLVSLSGCGFIRKKEANKQPQITEQEEIKEAIEIDRTEDFDGDIAVVTHTSNFVGTHYVIDRNFKILSTYEGNSTYIDGYMQIRDEENKKTNIVDTRGNVVFSYGDYEYEDIELVAKWEAIEYVRVSFDTDGGNTIKSKMIEKNTKLDKIEIPVKEGYTFKYWLLDNDIFDNDIIITKNITLKAVYEKNY